MNRPLLVAVVTYIVDCTLCIVFCALMHIKQLHVTNIFLQNIFLGKQETTLFISGSKGMLNKQVSLFLVSFGSESYEQSCGLSNLGKF